MARELPRSWRTTHITCPSAAARHRLVTEHLRELEGDGGAWFWVDLHRSTGGADPCMLEVSIGDGVATGWFRGAVAGGSVERADPVERSVALDPGLFPDRSVPGTYPLLLAAMSRRALRLLRAVPPDASGLGWPEIADELDALYRGLVPEPSARRLTMLRHAAWLDRTGDPHALEADHHPAGARGPRVAMAPTHEELGARLRAEVAGDDRVVAVARLAHAQVLRLRPDGPDGRRRESAVLRALASESDGRPRASNAVVPAIVATTVAEQAARQITLVGEAVGNQGDASRLLQALGGHFGDRDVTEQPRWSCLGDDCSPFEISLATSEQGSEVRFIVEAQADPASPGAYWEAGGRLTAALADVFDLDVRALESIAGLFAPTGGDPYWSMWHGFDLTDPLRMKVYLNPALGGLDRVPEIVRHALVRLGFTSAWPSVASALASGGAVSHVSLDVTSGGPPRLKLYVRFEHATVETLTVGPRLAGEDPDDVRRVCTALLGDPALLVRRAPFTTLYFVDPAAPRPARSAVHLPIQTYVADDARAGARVRALLEEFSLDSSPYERAAAVLADDAGELHEGLHSYVGFQRDETGPRVTTYFGARVYVARHGWQARSPQRTWSVA